MSKNNPKYDCIIRTYNSELTIKEVLFKLESQTINPKQIIFIDNNSEDKTKKIISECGESILINYPNQKFNYSKALNIGIGFLKSKYLFSFAISFMIYFQLSLKLQ